MVGLALADILAIQENSVLNVANLNQRRQVSGLVSAVQRILANSVKIVANQDLCQMNGLVLNVGMKATKASSAQSAANQEDNCKKNLALGGRVGRVKIFLFIVYLNVVR